MSESRPASFLRTVLFVATGALVSIACSSATDAPSSLGARCAGATECPDGRCVTSGDFPGGICTKVCNSSADCPSGWECASDSSGICLQKCSGPADCSSYGSQWTCKEESLQGSSSGKATLCSGR